MLKKIVLILIFLSSAVVANVSMNSSDKFYSGEAVLFSLEASGSDIDFPEIKTIDGFVVTQNGSSSSISIINGNRTQKISKVYKFFPTKTVIIPKLKIIIDNKEYFTKQKTINEIKAQKTKSKYIDFVIDVSKKELFVGEQTIFTLIFKYRRDLQIVDLGFSAPVFNNFWSKQVGEPKKYNEGAFLVQELKYIIFPQKSGKIVIPALKVDVSLVDSRNNNMSFFGPATRIEKVYSNELTLDVKELPKNTFLIGNFKIKDNIDKKVLNAGEALNFDIQINGRGNIDDIPEIKLDIPNATIYDNKAVKSYDMVDGQYGGTYKKSFSIVANEDILIPSISLNYYDKKENIIKELKTKEYKVKVKKNVQKEVQLYKQQDKQNEIKEAKPIIKVVETSDNQKLLYFFFGLMTSFLICILIFYVMKIKSQNKQVELPLEKEVKKATSVNELLNILLSYINIDKDLDKMIYLLENNKTNNLKQIKKDIIAIIKQKEIKD